MSHTSGLFKCLCWVPCLELEGDREARNGTGVLIGEGGVVRRVCEYEWSPEAAQPGQCKAVRR